MPKELGNLVELKELVIANNQLMGDIPQEFGQLVNLQVLQLQNNKFNSFNSLEFMQSKEILVFDFDGKKPSLKFRDINTTKTGVAETEFEEDKEN